MNWLPWLLRWIEVHTGVARGGPDPYYNFFSGVGSDIGELAIIGSLWGIYKKHNCPVHGCPRLCNYDVVGTPYRACKKHHPEVPKKVTSAVIADACLPHEAREHYDLATHGVREETKGDHDAV